MAGLIAACPGTTLAAGCDDHPGLIGQCGDPCPGFVAPEAWAVGIISNVDRYNSRRVVASCECGAIKTGWQQVRPMNTSIYGLEKLYVPAWCVKFVGNESGDNARDATAYDFAKLVDTQSPQVILPRANGLPPLVWPTAGLSSMLFQVVRSHPDTQPGHTDFIGVARLLVYRFLPMSYTSYVSERWARCCDTTEEEPHVCTATQMEYAQSAEPWEFPTRKYFPWGTPAPSRDECLRKAHYAQEITINYHLTRRWTDAEIAALNNGTKYPFWSAEDRTKLKMRHAVVARHNVPQTYKVSPGNHSGLVLYEDALAIESPPLFPNNSDLTQLRYYWKGGFSYGDGYMIVDPPATIPCENHLAGGVVLDQTTYYESFMNCEMMRIQPPS